LLSLEQHHPNIALRHLHTNASRCALMPDVLGISWINVHWQSLRIAGFELLLYSAFYDNRTRTVPAGGAVRIVSMFGGAPIFPEEALPFCHLWYRGQVQPQVSRVVRAEYIDHQEPSTQRLQTFMLTCGAPDRIFPKTGGVSGVKAEKLPYAVSIVNQPCDKATNLLKVHGKPNHEIPDHITTETPDFNDPSHPTWRVGVCGTAIFYLQYDFSLRLVEWLEFMRAQNVSQVFLYRTDRIHPNVDKVLKFYEETGFVTITDFHYPPSYVDDPLLRRAWTTTLRRHMFALENVYFTDCVLRNMNNFRFIAHIDPDELIIMKRQERQSMPEFVLHLTSITRESEEPVYSYNLRWKFFPAEESTENPDPLPAHFHILRHPRKLIEDKDPKHHNVKTIYDTWSATGVTSHTLRVCADGACLNPFKVNMKHAYMGHFRADCAGICGGATEYVPEVNAARRAVVEGVNAALRRLKLFPD